MSVKFGWFDIPIGGDPVKYSYSANQMRDIWRSLLTNGIVPELRQSETGTIIPTTQLGVSLSATPAQGLKITINKGIAWIDGAYFMIYEPEEIPIQAGWINDIVLRLDITGSEIVYGIFHKQRSAGTIQAGLTRQGGVYELGLHSVNVPTGATQVTADMITDYRLNLENGTDGKPCCGLVGSLIMPDIDKWYGQASEAQRKWFVMSQAEFTAWMNEEKNEFDKWFAVLEATLDSNIVTNLINLINKNKDDLKAHAASALHVFPLTHTLTDTTHTLVGTIPTTGIIQASFKATSDFESGDSITLNGVNLSFVEEPVFTSGYPVQAVIDMNDRKISFGSGGGGGKMFNTIKIPASGKYDVAGGKWLEQTIPLGVAYTNQSAILGDFIYSYLGNNFSKRYLETNTYTPATMTVPTSTSIEGLLTYNDEIYAFGFTTSTNYLFTIYKVNIDKLLLAQVHQSTISVGVNNLRSMKTFPISTSKFLFIGSGAIISYDFTTNFSKILFNASRKAHVGYAVQMLSDGNYLIAMTSSPSDADNKFNIAKYFTASDTITENVGELIFPNNVNKIQTFQLGNKLIFVSYDLQNGSNTGEIDLKAQTIDTTKYPNHSLDTSTGNSATSGFIYQNNLTFFSTAKKYYLPLLQSPPEQNAVVAKIYKGQSYNTPFDTVEMSSIPNQATFTVSPQTKKATQNLSIHLGQYEHIGELPINVWEG